MLKLLLAHWKTHRAAAPPDLTFEPFYLRDPIIGRTETINPYSVNRINPIYESDGRSSATPPDDTALTSSKMAGGTPPPTAPKPSTSRGGILRNGGTRQQESEVKNQSTTTEEAMSGVTRSDCTKEEASQSTENSSKPSTPPNPSEDSGITRGDQATSDSIPSETELPPSKEKGKRRYNRRSGIRACKKCKKYQKPGGKWSCDDYYTRAILEDRTQPDGWTSDLSAELCPSCDPLQRTRNRRSFHVLSPPLEREEVIRCPPEGSADTSVLEDRSYKSRGCPCGRWYDVLAEKDRYDRLHGDPYFWSGPCLCGSPSSIYYSQRRKVKFAGEVHKQDVDFKKESPIPENLDNKDVKKSEGSDDSRTNLAEKSLKSLTLENIQSYPWTIEGWDSLVRQRILQKRRRRAFYMGIMALTLVIFVGLVVAIVLIYLRRRNA